MTIEKCKIIIIRGAPGVGKSTLANRLRTIFKNGFLIEVDVVRGMINSVKWVNTEEHLHALDAAAEVVRIYLNVGYRPAIIIDTFSPSKLNYFLAKLPFEIEYQIISLYSNEDILKKRIENRKTGFNDLESCYKLNDEVKKYRHKNELFLDTTEFNIEDVFSEAVKLIT